jgi:hypothetical protein
MDSAWMIKKWKEMQGRPFDIIAERESIYKVLSQTNPNNLKKKYSEYTILNFWRQEIKWFQQESQNPLSEEENLFF